MIEEARSRRASAEKKGGIFMEKREYLKPDIALTAFCAMDVMQESLSDGEFGENDPYVVEE